MQNILFITAHPDDESLWCPGLIHEFSQYEEFQVYVLCLWDLVESRDQHREAEFYEATNSLNCKSLIANDSKESPILQIINKYNLQKDCFNLIVTHSPYGDEHEHIHHKNVYQYAKNKARSLNIGFAYFTYITPPGTYISKLKSGLRSKNCHLINILENFQSKQLFFQFSFDLFIKKQALASYKSVDSLSHQNGYYAWTSPIEGYICENESAINLFMRLISKFHCPIEKDIFTLGF